MSNFEISDRSRESLEAIGVSYKDLHRAIRTYIKNNEARIVRSCLETISPSGSRPGPHATIHSLWQGQAEYFDPEDMVNNMIADQSSRFEELWVKREDGDEDPELEAHFWQLEQIKTSIYQKMWEAANNRLEANRSEEMGI